MSKVHPRNEGTSGLDLAILLFMPISVAILGGIIWYLGALLNA